MSQHELQLCGQILEEHFGCLVEKVATTLIARGRSTLPALVQATKLSVKITREKATEGTRAVVYYQASIREILLRERFPLFIHTAASLFGAPAGLIVQKTLENGTLSPSKIGPTDDMSIGQLSEGMAQLLDGAFLVPLQATDHVTLNDKLIREEREAVANAGMGAPLTSTELTKLRKSLAQQRSEFNQSVDVGSKRKVVLDFEDEENKKKQRGEQYTIEKDEKFYRINTERFNLHLRNSQIAHYVKNYVNETGASLIQAMLNYGFPRMASCKEKLSPSVRRDMLGTLLRGQDFNIHGRVSNPAIEYMDLLMSAHSQIITNIDGSQYAVNLRNAVRALQVDMIESIIQEKFGLVSRRIWRLLHMRSKQDEKQVGKQAMVNNKVARECLYAMFKAGFVFLQDVPKTVDHSASRTYFLWYTSVERTCSILLSCAYNTSHRLKLRRKKEMADRTHLIEKTKRTDVLSGEAGLSEHDIEKLEELKQVQKQLQFSEWRIDEMVMLLRDFQ
ncbi:RNA polymerase III subunit C82 [Polyrhizophydium stewartii]|uniref:DNA-directed RNA polymerase III subunit RPC3 n=1 Tax=Polyrhizophydium stewartii TaxID=2732419 RepID=A0ABR4ND82_9FUNG